MKFYCFECDENKPCIWDAPDFDNTYCSLYNTLSCVVVMCPIKNKPPHESPTANWIDEHTYLKKQVDKSFSGDYQPSEDLNRGVG